jgi:hypothetical protein
MTVIYIEAFSVMTLCSLRDENGGSMFLQNVGNHVTGYSVTAQKTTM